MKFNSAYDLNNATTILMVDKGDITTTATGFFFAFENSDSVYLVTNKHVLQNAKKLIIPLEQDDENFYGYIVQASNFISHPSESIDLAIAEIVELKNHNHTNMGQNKTANIKIVQENMVLTQGEIKSLGYCEEILVFGAPNGNCDINNHLLVARKGITATPPGRSYKGNGFVVDIPLSPGASGSPVFWLTATTMSSFQSTKLLGIISHARVGKSQEENPIYLHLGNAIPGYFLFDFKSLVINQRHQDKP